MRTTAFKTDFMRMISPASQPKSVRQDSGEARGGKAVRFVRSSGGIQIVCERRAAPQNAAANSFAPGLALFESMRALVTASSFATVSLRIATGLRS